MDMEEKVQMLLGMGFADTAIIKQALWATKGDVSEAVSILCYEKPMPVQALESYQSQLDEQQQGVSSDGAGDGGGATSGENISFPSAYLMELEHRTYADTWSIPFKREESLGVCLVSATRLAKEGLAEADDMCRRFLEQVVPEVFQKLLNSQPVRSWSTGVLEGVYDMTSQLVELIVTRLRYDPVPIPLLHVLTLTLNPRNEFNRCNSTKAWDKSMYEYEAKEGQARYSGKSGFLAHLINKLGSLGGFEKISELVCAESNEDAQGLAALLSPVASCSELVNPSLVKPILEPCMTKCASFVKGLGDEDLKQKKVLHVSDLLMKMKALCVNLWPPKCHVVDEIRLDLVLRMINTTHFNAKMIALREITVMIDEFTEAQSEASRECLGK